MAESLRSLWKTFSSKFGAKPDVADKYWDIIKTKHSEKHRFYHTLRHLEEMFCHLDDLSAQLEDPVMVAMAIFFHDVIYEPKETDNEERSADLFQQFSKECSDCDDEKCQAVYDWILQTKSHMTKVTMETDLYEDGDMYYFLDMDMAILAANRERYVEYARQIRDEYSHRRDFSEARCKVLQTFLKRTNIYNTRYFRTKCEEAARHNLAWEIETLQKEATH